MWKRLQHPNIVPFLGVPTKIPPFEIVREWMENDWITAYVRKHPEVDHIGLVSEFVVTVTIHCEHRIPQLWDVADGLHYLHSCNIIHGDLKGVSHLILRPQPFSKSDVNPYELEGERFDRRERPRPSRRLRIDIHYLWREFDRYFSGFYQCDKHDDLGGT